jgi:hypothetical protein
MQTPLPTFYTSVESFRVGTVIAEKDNDRVVCQLQMLETLQLLADVVIHIFTHADERYNRIC